MEYRAIFPQEFRAPLQRHATSAAPSDALGVTLQGVSCVYREPADRIGYFVQFEPGCFDMGGNVEFRLDHDKELRIGSTETGELQLIDSFDALRFVMRLPDTPLGRRAHREFEAGLRGISAGVIIEDEDIRTMRDGEEISTVYSGRLVEISLVTAPGIQGCYAERLEPGMRREDEIAPFERVLRSCTSRAELKFWTERALECGYQLP